MAISRKCRIVGLLAVLIGCAAGLSGCLESRDAVLGRYDAQHDEFVFLNVFQQIVGHDQKELDYLESLWRNRAHVITLPMPQLMGKAAILRYSATEFASINLGERKEISRETSPVNLDQIRVLPGTFFLRGQDSLCYYDQVVIPGKMIDELLPYYRDSMTTALAAGIDAERKRRADGGAVFPWDKARQQALADLAAGDSSANQAANPQPADAGPKSMFELLQPASLDRLAASAHDGTFTLTREKQFFRLHLPLSAEDAKQVLETARAYRQAVAAKPPNADTQKGLWELSKLLPALDVTAPDANSLLVTLDAGRLFQCMDEVQRVTADLPVDANAPNGGADTVAAMRKRGLPIADNVSIKQVLTDFKAGTLKALPVEETGKIGDGLAEPPGAKTGK